MENDLHATLPFIQVLSCRFGIVYLSAEARSWAPVFGKSKTHCGKVEPPSRVWGSLALLPATTKEGDAPGLGVKQA